MTKNVEVNFTNGYIDLGVMSLQTGSSVTIYDGVTTFMEAPYIDEIVTTDGISAITTYEAYSVPPFPEIAYIYKLNGSNITGSEKFEQAAVADATHFAYDPATKIIDLPTGVFDPNELLIAQYVYKAFGQRIVSDVEHFSLNAKVVVDLTTEDICTSQITHSQYIFPKARVDGNFEVIIVLQILYVTIKAYFVSILKASHVE